MSRDDRNDDFTPSWDDSELDWLEDLMDERARKPAPSPRPVETRRDPGYTGENADFYRDNAAEEPVRPAAARRKTAEDSEEEYERYRRYSEDTEPRRRKTNVPLVIVVILLLGGMLFAGWQLGSILLGYHRDRTAYNELAANAISGLNFDEPVTVPADDGEEDTAAPQATPVISQVPISVDWDYLRSVNPNVVGWIYSPGTVINYPVVQTQDHDYYLKHGFDGGSNSAGTLFADKSSVAGITQSNYIIYGHNMKDGSMFASLVNYSDPAYYSEHPVMYYLTPDASYRVDLIGCHIVEPSVDNYPTYFDSLTSYQAYIDRISPRFFWMNAGAFRTDYQLLTLSTCTYTAESNDMRLLVHGVMVPIR